MAIYLFGTINIPINDHTENISFFLLVVLDGIAHFKPFRTNGIFNKFDTIN